MKTKPKKKEVKAWIVLKKKNSTPERFVRELSPIEYEVFPKKEKVNEDYHRIVKCKITYEI